MRERVSFSYVHCKKTQGHRKTYVGKISCITDTHTTNTCVDRERDMSFEERLSECIVPLRSGS